jgi:hypothetical protein
MRIESNMPTKSKEKDGRGYYVANVRNLYK